MFSYNKRVTRLLEEKGLVGAEQLRDTLAIADARNVSIATLLVEQKVESMEKGGELELKESSDEADEEDLNKLDQGALGEDDDSPVVKFVNAMIYQAAKERASDIHIEPYEKRISVRFRGDGSLRE